MLNFSHMERDQHEIYEYARNRIKQKYNNYGNGKKRKRIVNNILQEQ